VLSSRTSRWSAGTALVCVLVVAAAWFLLITPRRAEADTTRQQQATVAQANDLLRVKVAQLRAQAANLGKTRDELVKLHQEFPPTADLPGLIRTVSRLSTAAGTDLLSITPGSASQLRPAGAAGAGGGAGAAGAGAGASTGVIAVELSMEATGDYYQVVGFIRQLQSQMTRDLLITGIKVDKIGDGPTDGVKLVLTGTVFTMPDGATTKTSTASQGTGSPGTAGSAAASSGVGNQ